MLITIPKYHFQKMTTSKLMRFKVSDIEPSYP